MKKLNLLLLVFCICTFLGDTIAQQCVFTSQAPPTVNSGCTSNYLEYLNDPTSIYNEPILTVRVNMHVMQDANGANSFPNNAIAISFLSGLFGTDPIATHTLNFTPYGG